MTQHTNRRRVHPSVLDDQRPSTRWCLRPRAGMLLLLLTLSTTGCAEISQFAYRCSCAFDPAFPAVPGVAAHCDPAVDAVDYAAPVDPSAFNLRGEFDQMQREMVDLQAKLAELNQEVLHRNQALIDSRMELASVQNDIRMLRENVTNWELGVNDLRRTMHQRNEERLREIRRLAAAVEKLGMQQATAIQQISDTPATRKTFSLSEQFEH